MKDIPLNAWLGFFKVQTFMKVKEKLRNYFFHFHSIGTRQLNVVCNPGVAPGLKNSYLIYSSLLDDKVYY